MLEGAEDASVGDISEEQEEVALRTDERDRRRGRRRASFNDSNLDTTWNSGDRIVPTRDHRARQSSVDAYNALPAVRQSRSRAAPADQQEQYYTRGRAPTRPYQVPRHDKQQLKAQAMSFLFNNLARRCIWQWHAQTVHNQRNQKELLQIAILHDKRTLLKQSLAQLRDAVFDSDFWDQQARRAARARDLFLLTKAFTHWAQSASDEVARTNIARRHILRTRYFNAWRDITAVNELKCRRAGLRKWFGIWRTKTNARLDRDEKAITFNDSRLLERTYWAWFWAFCNRKAPLWREFRLKAVPFDKLMIHSADVHSRTLATEDLRDRTVQLECLLSMHQRASRLLNDEAAALELHKKQLLASSFSAVRRKNQFEPRIQQLQKTSSRRLQRSALIDWHSKASASRLARKVDEQRVIHNAWTAWNDRLRTQALHFKIDDRLLVQSLYKWVLEARLSLFSRLKEHRQKSDALRQLDIRATERRSQLDEASQLLQQSQRQRLLRTTLIKIHGISRRREHDELAAVEFRNSRDLPSVVQRWKGRCSREMRLHAMAGQARFYFLASKSIKKWKEATTNSQKRRRREAYAAIRRQHKMGLARRTLGSLVSRARTLHAARVQAEQLSLNKTVVICQQYLHHWHTQSEHWQADEQRADSVISQYRLGDALSALSLRLSEIEAQEEQAQAVARAVQDKFAYRVFRRLGDKLFVLGRQADTAQAWQDRKFGQHRKEMVRYWAVRANERRAARLGPDPDTPSKTPVLRTSRLGRRPVADTDFVSTLRLDDTIGDAGAEAAATDVDMSFGATPRRPGYLQSATRSAMRGRSRFRAAPERHVATPAPASGVLDFGSSVIGSTTPAPFVPGGVIGMETLTPQITPFNRKMMAGGYSRSHTPLTAPLGAPRTGSRFGASTGARGTDRIVRFGEAIDEDGSVVGESEDGSPTRR